MMLNSLFDYIMNRFLIYLFSLFFSVTIYANDYDPNTCKGGTDLKNALAALMLTPSTKFNGQLMAEISLKYGEDLTKIILMKHPSLSNPAGKINLKTVHWILDSFFYSGRSPNKRVYFSPFVENTNRVIVSMIDLMVADSFPLYSAIPLFVHKEQYKKVKEAFMFANFKFPISLFKKFYGVNSETARKMTMSLYSNVFRSDNYHIGFSGLKKHVGVLQIIGHSIPGNDSIEEEGLKMHFKDMVKILKEKNIPTNLPLSIYTCYGACGKLSGYNKTDFTEDELKKLFIDKKIQTLMEPIEFSFAYMFAEELFKELPAYTGSITAYQGVVTIVPFTVFTRDPKKPLSLITDRRFGVGLITKEGKYVWFDALEMTHVYTRENMKSQKLLQ